MMIFAMSLVVALSADGIQTKTVLHAVSQISGSTVVFSRPPGKFIVTKKTIVTLNGVRSSVEEVAKRWQAAKDGNPAAQVMLYGGSVGLELTEARFVLKVFGDVRNPNRSLAMSGK
jgi:UDP-N-acetylglucosamine:LPS N-acetylglucosamine transferase